MAALLHHNNDFLLPRKGKMEENASENYGGTEALIYCALRFTNIHTLWVHHCYGSAVQTYSQRVIQKSLEISQVYDTLGFSRWILTRKSDETHQASSRCFTWNFTLPGVMNTANVHTMLSKKWTLNTEYRKTFTYPTTWWALKWATSLPSIHCVCW